MQLHQISKNSRHKLSRRVGRGGKRGTFSGRGVKGQKARSGRKLRPEWRDILKSIPKKRGYRFEGQRPKPLVVSLKSVNRIFGSGEMVTPDTLQRKGLIVKNFSFRGVKVLGQEKLNKKLTFKGVALSAAARDAIIKAGGSIS